MKLKFPALQVQLLSLLSNHIKQLNVSGIDFRLLAQDMGVPTAGAASKRWQRYRKRLKETTGINADGGGIEKGSPRKPVGVQKNGNGGKGRMKGMVGSRGVKREEDSDEDDDGGRDKDDGEGEVKPVAVSTPTRKLPGRISKSKVKSFKIEDQEDEEEEEEAEIVEKDEEEE